MKPGSVTVDLAAEAGGNIETTVKDQRIVTDNGVICLGYTDLPSRLANTSSSLYANNISKFLLSIGPQTTKQAGYYFIDHEDEAVRGMLVVEEGKLMYPAPLPPPPPVVEKKEEETKPVEIDYKAPYVSGAKTAGLTSLAVLGMGAVAPNPAFSSMFTTFALSNVIGVQVVLGVTHALHSPLMAVTNAISGMWLAGVINCACTLLLVFCRGSSPLCFLSGTTALGGMHLVAHSTNFAVGTLGALATTLSTVRLALCWGWYLRFVRRFGFCLNYLRSARACCSGQHCRWFHCHYENVGHVQASG